MTVIPITRAIEPKAQSVNLEDYIESFIRFRQVKSNTADTYRSQISSFLENCSNPLLSSSIHYWIEEAKEDYAMLTVKSMVETVKTFLEYLDNHDIAKNKAHLQIIFKYDYTGGNHKRVPKDKFVDMLRSCDLTTYNGLRDYALIRLYQSTGMRIHEPLKCKIEDIEVIDTFSTDGQYTKIRIPLLKFVQKGNRTSYVRLFPKTYDAIQAYLKARPDSACKTHALFASHSTKSKTVSFLSQNSATKMMRAKFNYVGLFGREYSTHSFRYEQGMRVLDKTGNESLASQQLRHLSPKAIQFYVQEVRAMSNAKTMINLEW